MQQNSIIRDPVKRNQWCQQGHQFQGQGLNVTECNRIQPYENIWSGGL